MTDFLAVDTSSKYLTVVAKKGERTVVNHLPECAMKHSVILMDEIENTLEEAGLSLNECQFFAAVTGPGSFTGIRIGLSTVKGFCVGTDKPSVGVTSFELIAYNVNSRVPFGVAIDAMHGNYYFQSFTQDGARLTEPAYLSADEVEKTGLPVYGFEELPLPRYTKMNAGDCLLNAVERAKNKGVSVLHALYVRKSQAEENASAHP